MSATSNFEAAIEYFDDFVLILLPTCVQIMFNKCLSQNHFSQLGKHKTISVLKSEDALGLTITDNTCITQCFWFVDCPAFESLAPGS